MVIEVEVIPRAYHEYNIRRSSVRRKGSHGSHGPKKVKVVFFSESSVRLRDYRFLRNSVGTYLL